MPKKPNYAAQFDEQPADESDDFKRVFGGVKVPKGLQPSTSEITALEWVDKSPVALTIDVELTEAEWHALIIGIEKIKRRYQWYLGDAMVYGIDRKYGETDEQIAYLVEITGKDDKTLHDYYKTALLFEKSERSELLEFEQHRVIARAFSEDTPEHRAERLRWLYIAETQAMSGRRLKAEIDAAKATLPALDAPQISEDAAEDPPAPAPEDEEAADLPPVDLPLDSDEAWKTVHKIQTVLKTRSYHNLAPKQKTEIQRAIDAVRHTLTMLEAELRKK